MDPKCSGNRRPRSSGHVRLHWCAVETLHRVGVQLRDVARLAAVLLHTLSYTGEGNDSGRGLSYLLSSYH